MSSFNCQASIWMDILVIVVIFIILLPGGLLSIPAVPKETIERVQGYKFKTPDQLAAEAASGKKPDTEWWRQVFATQVVTVPSLIVHTIIVLAIASLYAYLKAAFYGNIDPSICANRCCSWLSLNKFHISDFLNQCFENWNTIIFL